MRWSWLLVLFIANIDCLDAVKCVSCAGQDCMTNACDSDICVASFYAANWNEGSWQKARSVRGCMSGTIINPSFQDYCETTTDSDMTQIQVCYCKSELCNSHFTSKLPSEPMRFVECNCEGRQCREATCKGIYCTYTVNHLTMQTERGCSNLSVPLFDRRIADACMSPPIAGALHTNVARTGDDLLHTEQCFCTTSHCNSGAPLVSASKEMRCAEEIRGQFYGHTLASNRRRDCLGELCFNSDVKSDLGEPSEFSVSGCMSFINGSQLADVMNPTGCGYFLSEDLVVRSCFHSTDANAVQRSLNSRRKRLRTSAVVRIGQIRWLVAIASVVKLLV